MTPNANLDALAETSPFIFVGSIRAGAESTSVVVAVDDAVKTPRGFVLKGREVTVRLVKPLPAGRYVFFADPESVGNTVAVRERGHIEASQQSALDQVTAAYTRASRSRMARRSQSAILVALGSVGQLKAVGEISESGQLRPEVVWVTARFTIERVLKGDRKLKSVLVVGPRIATSRLPYVPALRPALHAILFLQRPPNEALDALPKAQRGRALFIADSSDITPPDALSEVESIAREERSR
jgi:hypothetical protein